MTRIPMGNFGNRLAQAAPQGRQLPAMAFGADVAGPLAEGLGVAANAFQAEEQKRAEEKKALDKTEGMLRWVDHENTVLETANDISLKLQRGELSREDAAKTLDEEIRKSESSALGKIAPDLRGPSQLKFEGIRNRANRAMQGTIEQHQRNEIGSNLEFIRDQMMKQATIPGSNLDDLKSQFEEAANHLGPQAGMNQEKLGKLIQDFKDGATFNSYKQRVIEGMGNQKALRELEAQIKTDPGLDSDKRLALLSGTQGQIATLQNRAAIEAERRDRANAQAWQSAVDIVQGGKPLSPDFAASLGKTLKGTPYEKALRELMTQAPQSQSFSAQPLKQQEAALLNLQARGNASGWSPEDKKLYDQLDRVHGATKKEIEADPWKAGIERGVVPDIPPINPGDLAALPAQLARRTKQAETLSVWAGKDVSPLRPEEAKQIGGLLNALPAATRAEALGTIAKTMTPGQMSALSAQLGDKSLNIAGLLAGRDLRTEKGRLAAEIYLKGVDAMREKRINFDEPAQAKIREEIHRKVDGAYLTESGTRDAVEAAMGVYKGLKSEGRSSAVDEAVAIATGGIMSYNGAKLAKPYGWTDSQVKDAVRAVTPERARNLFGAEVLIGGEKVTAEAFAKSLPGARLGPSPKPGAYSVIVGGRIVTGLDGRPLALPLEGR